MFSKLQQRSLLFYFVYTEYNKTQQEIADFFNVSQSTVAQGIKEAAYLITIREYEKEIAELKSQIQRSMIQGGMPPIIDVD